MKEIKVEEMKLVDGGASANPTLINSIYKVFDFIFELGEALGSYIRRVSDNKMCDI